MTSTNNAGGSECVTTPPQGDAAQETLTSHEAQLVTLRRDLDSLQNRMGTTLPPQPSAPNPVGAPLATAPHPEDAAPQPFEKDISKLWTLYHRLARRLDE
eukprot:2164721-Amphidinium_carterae.1